MDPQKHNIEVLDAPSAGHAAHCEMPPQKEVVSVSDIDVGLQIIAQTEHVQIDPGVTKSALQKIDIWILAQLALTTMLQFLDKSSLGYAAIFGLTKDTNLKGQDLSWLASIFYFGYLTMQPFAAWLLQKLPAGKCLAVSVFFWGFLLFMHIICKDWSQLMVVRYLLGMAEGIVTPAFVLISSAWYSRQQQPWRMAIWFLFNGVALIIGGLMSYGLGQVKSGIASWKWMFILPGALSVIWAVCLWFGLPDNQGTAWFLTDREKRAAIEMVRTNHTGIHNNRFHKEQIVEAMLDIKTWTFFLLALFWTVPNSLVTFGSLVIKNFDYGALETTLLGMPTGGYEIIVMLTLAYICLRTHNTRIICIEVALILQLVGSIMVFAAPYHNKGALLAGYYMMYSSPTGYILLLAVVSGNTAGHTKKVVTGAVTMIGYSCGNIIGPQFFKPSGQPRYRLGIGACLTSTCVCITVTFLLQVHLMRQNKLRKALREDADAHNQDNNTEFDFKNLTDKENPLFVYVY